MLKMSRLSPSFAISSYVCVFILQKIILINKTDVHYCFPTSMGLDANTLSTLCRFWKESGKIESTLGDL